MCIVVIGGGLVLFSACSMSTGGKADIDTKIGNLYKIEESKDNICKLGEINKDPIYNGSAEGIKLLYCGDYVNSFNAFDAAVNGFEKSSMGDYKGLFYELPILRTYQGVDQLLASEVMFDKNAVEESPNPTMESAHRLFRLAGDEQEKIKLKYEKEIEKAAQDMGGSNNFLFKLMQNLANSAIKDNTSELMGINCDPKNRGEDSIGSVDDCKILQAEGAFVNTYIEFMEFIGGLFEGGESVDEVRNRLLTVKDKNASVEIFKVMFEKLYGENAVAGSNVFVVYENGESKGLEDYEISFPIPANLNHIKDNAVKLAATYATLSLDTKLDKAFIEAIGGLTEARGVFPKLTDSKSSYEFLKVANGTDSQDTKLLADMDKIITKDYNSNLTITMLKAIFDAAVKTAINMAAADKNPLLGFAANKATEAVNHSDLRRVVGLPKNYQLTMVTNDGKVSIKDNEGNEIFSKEDLAPNKNYLIYVKSPKVGVNYVKVIESSEVKLAANTEKNKDVE